MEEKTFPTSEAAVRLRDVARWDPSLSGNRFMVEFCSYLAGRIEGHGIVPSGFIMAYLLVAEDARRGKDGFTGGPMPRGLSGQHPVVYAVADRLQASVARAAFGDEFGDLVDAQVKVLFA